MIHAVQRAKERYGIDLDLEYARRQIEDGKSIKVTKLSKSRQLHIIPYGDMNLPVVWSRTAKVVVTVLPKYIRENIGALKLGQIQQLAHMDCDDEAMVEAMKKAANRSACVLDAAKAYRDKENAKAALKKTLKARIVARLIKAWELESIYAP